jgi:N-methylhydantoinase A
MVRALRVVTVQRGIDPRGYALLAFGGAGPLHAAAIADELGIDRIVCPRASGVLAALGLVVSPRRRDAQRSVLWSGESLTAEAVAAEVRELSGRAREALGEPDSELSAVYELRYRGQAFELAIAADLAPELDQLRTRFEAEHEDRYGYSDPDGELELVTIRVSATVPGAEVELQDAAEGGRPETTTTTREATLGGEQRELTVLRGAPPPETPIEGPGVVELAESTLLVPDGWTGEVDATGTIQIRRQGDR